jgi:hypothetical protein
MKNWVSYGFRRSTKKHGLAEPDKFAGTSRWLSENQLNVAEEETAALLRRFSGNPDVVSFKPPIAEGCYQHGTPQDTKGRNFVPKPGLTRYHKRTRNCLWNGTTVCQGAFS